MKVDLEELRQQIESEFKRIEQQEGELQKQLQHLAVVQGLAEASPAEGSSKNGLDISNFREALLGGESS